VGKKSTFTDEDKIFAAARYYEPLSKGEPKLKLNNITTVLGKCHSTTAGRLVRQAVSAGLVKIGITMGDIPDAERDNALELALSDELGVQYPIVVKTPEGRPGYEAFHGDYVHRVLGQAMAKEIAAHSTITRDSRFALGSGRGVFYAVDALHRWRALQATDVTLLSLSGSLVPRAHAEQLSMALDSDVHVVLMGLRFRTPVTLQLISYPIAPRNIESARQRTWLDPQKYSALRPTRALLGVGVLETGHRFYAEVAGKSGDPPSALEPVRNDLGQLVELVKAVRTRPGARNAHYCPVADIANCLFFVDPPDGFTLDPGERRALKSGIKGLNARLLTLRTEQLRGIDNIMLVAGTPKKALAIRQLLTRGELNISTLCVDDKAARIILQPEGKRTGRQRASSTNRRKRS